MPRENLNLKGTRGVAPKPIDWDEVDKLLKCDCTGTEVAAALGICADTLYDRCAEEKGVVFSIYAAAKKSHGDALLRQAQFSSAMKQNSTMLIWLGKNRLKQKDVDVHASSPNHTMLDSMFGEIKKLAGKIDEKLLTGEKCTQESDKSPSPEISTS